MGELVAISESSVLRPQVGFHSRHLWFTSFFLPTNNKAAKFLKIRSHPAVLSGLLCFNPHHKKSLSGGDFRAAAATSDARVKSTLDFEPLGEGIEIEYSGGGGDDSSDGFGGGGGGGGEGGGGGGDGGSGDGNSNKNQEGKGGSGGTKKIGMSMSQKLTLGYAALVGFGGVMGYLKSGSVKSLVSGGVSALLLCLVYAQLPTKPVVASSMGLAVSVTLLGVMGSRFMRSGKIFPAGVVSFVSLIMGGGYLHGIFRGAH